MARALSQDLRDQVVAATDDGMSYRAAAARFGVGVATAVRWRQLAREYCRTIAGKPGGDQRSSKTDVHADRITAMLAENSDVTLAEIQSGLSAPGVHIGISTLSRFFDRRGITRQKRPGTRSSKTAPDILSQRRAWFDSQLDLAPERLVFIDETWTATNMNRGHGGRQRRAPADGLPAWPPQDDHAGRRAADERHGRADDARWPD